MRVPLLNFFPNSMYISVSSKSRICINSGQKVIFSKGDPYSISILVSYYSPIMLASFKSKFGMYFAQPNLIFEGCEKLKRGSLLGNKEPDFLEDSPIIELDG